MISFILEFQHTVTAQHYEVETVKLQAEICKRIYVNSVRIKKTKTKTKQQKSEVLKIWKKFYSRSNS